MKLRKTFFIALGALAFLTFAPLSGFAQETDSPPTEATTLPAEPAMDQDPETLEDLLVTLENLSEEAEALQGVTELAAEDVRVVDVAVLVDETNAEVLQEALDQKSAEVDVLREVLTSNEAVQQALASSEAAVEEVVAVEVDQAGDVVVFVLPEEEE